MAILLLPVVIVLAWSVVYLGRHAEPVKRARFLKKIALGVMMAYGGFIALFVAGESMSDPGGWKGAGLVASWAVPLVALALAGWFSSPGGDRSSVAH